MTTTVTNNEAASRYELSIDDEVVGVADYHRSGDLVDFTHTEIDVVRRDNGLGSVLIEGALNDVKRQSLSVLPHCWFVRAQIAAHPGEYLELVPADRRQEFDLPAA